MNKKILILTMLALFGISSSPAYASHSWGNYHWARTSNLFTLTLADNVSSVWDGYLSTTSSDWSLSTVFDATVILGRARPKTCKATNGRVEVCSERYGANGWLGVAQVWVSGNHIVKGTTKVNDTYFNTGTYNTPAWRNLVMCQEVGHTLGLDHQDESFNNPNLGTCMDYTNSPSSNQHPNAHDYEQLETMYSHLDSINTAFSSVVNAPRVRTNTSFRDTLIDVESSDPSAWGKAIEEDAQGKKSLFVRDFGKDEKVFTFVIWAE